MGIPCSKEKQVGRGMSELGELDKVEDTTVTVKECREIISKLILKFPDDSIDDIRELSLAVIRYLYACRMGQEGDQDEALEADVISYSLLNDGLVCFELGLRVVTI